MYKFREFLRKCSAVQLARGSVPVVVSALVSFLVARSCNEEIMSDRAQPASKRGGGSPLPPLAPPPGGADGLPELPRARYVQTRDSRGRTRAVSAARDDAFASEYPAIAEYLTAMLVGDRGRLTATIICMAEDGQWKLCLSDRETDTVTWASADTWQAAWRALEGNLASGTAVWREKRPYNPKSGR